MPNRIQEIGGLFLFIFAVVGVAAFPAFWYFVDLRTAIFATPMLAVWQSFMFLIVIWGINKLQESSYTFQNFWWVWAATRVEIDFDDENDYVGVDVLDDWCEENITGKWERMNGWKYAFLRTSDAVAFKLRWYQ